MLKQQVRIDPFDRTVSSAGLVCRLYDVMLRRRRLRAKEAQKYLNVPTRDIALKKACLRVTSVVV
jgi:hypothetical protein